jgi:ubiquinone/menaquinone biosynthesis C-methylase UbiE
MNDKGTEPVIRFLYEPYERYYDNLKFIHKPAERLAVYARIKPGQKVLDVACGTGLATKAAAKIMGNTGIVIGIDISDKWLGVAKERAISADLPNIEYQVGNAEALEFGESYFDNVICASSIFYFPDIPGALREWNRVLKTDGTVAFTSFGESFLQPVINPLGTLLSRYDGQPPPAPFFIERTNTPEKCCEFMKQAGFKEIDVITENLDCRYPDITAYWQEIGLSFISPRLARLSSDELERFKAEHLSEIESLYADKPILIEFPTIFSVAKKP